MLKSKSQRISKVVGCTTTKDINIHNLIMNIHYEGISIIHHMVISICPLVGRQRCRLRFHLAARTLPANKNVFCD